MQTLAPRVALHDTVFPAAVAALPATIVIPVKSAVE